MKYLQYAPRVVREDSEASVHLLACEYLKTRYPFAIFRTDLGGIRLRPAQASMVKQLNSSRGFPDLFIAEPMEVIEDPNEKPRLVAGLFIELKRASVKVYKRNGELRTDLHLVEQAKMLERLRKRGYKAEFACGFDEFRAIVDQYLGGTTI